MSNLNFSINIPGAELNQMGLKILEEFRVHLSKVFLQIKPFIIGELRPMINEALQSSPTWDSISSGEIQKTFFIDSANSALSAIKTAVIEGVVVDIQPVINTGKSVTGGLSVKMLDDGFSSLTHLAEGSYTTANGRNVNWLEYLLFNGTSPMYLKAKLIRTKRGIILGTADTDLAISPADAGTQGDNFLTRALLPVEVKLLDIIENEISRRS